MRNKRWAVGAGVLTLALLALGAAPALAVSFGAGVVIVEPSHATYTIPAGEAAVGVPQKSNHSWNAAGNPNQILNVGWLCTLSVNFVGLDSRGADPDLIQLDPSGTFNSGVITLQSGWIGTPGDYRTDADTEVHDNNSPARAYVDATKQWTVRF